MKLVWVILPWCFYFLEHEKIKKLSLSKNEYDYQTDKNDVPFINRCITDTGAYVSGFLETAQYLLFTNDSRRCRDAALVGGNKFPAPESAITPPTRLSARGGCVG